MSVTIDDVREVAGGLPRSTEMLAAGRLKFRVGRVVWLAVSADQTRIGFAFPREEREVLVTSEPAVFLLPRASDLRFHWVEARLDALDVARLREIVLDAWRFVVPSAVAVAGDDTG
ncbi:MAG: MmcQ/YjbR family DNA-binding protein [Humibacillus sp.]|nr:MmcQ/YjbR family DNA-binding protein [Humibacillus sp.]MDN5777369.1 MmcQ/YjbR family DNA-binding protein [Humibacillus sp.]